MNINHQTHRKSSLIKKTPQFILLISILLSSTACSSKSLNELQIFEYKEAIRAFQEKQHDTPGVWTCSYIEKSNTESITDAESLMVEIDEKYIYVKHNNQLTELSLTTRHKENSIYKDKKENLSLQINVIKKSNYSEYRESHDRIAEAELNVSGEKYKLQLLGEACGI